VELAVGYHRIALHVIDAACRRASGSTASEARVADEARGAWHLVDTWCPIPKDILLNTLDTQVAARDQKSARFDQDQANDPTLVLQSCEVRNALMLLQVALGLL